MDWCVLIALVLAVPFILGAVPVKYMDSSQRTPAMVYMCGWFVSFFVFELIAVPFILLERSFTSLVIVYTAVIVVLLAISLWAFRAIWRDLAASVRSVKKQPPLVRLGWVAAFLIIGVQMYIAIFYEYYDGDDAYYIATSVLTDTFDTMYLRDAYTGYIYSLDARHALSPTPIYQAWLARLSGIHPAVIAHSVLSAVWLMLMYCIYGQIAGRLFKDDKRNYRPVFMILIAVWFMFGNVSLYTAETFAMTRTWQGKGLMAGMALPALLLCLIDLSGERTSLGAWMLYECVIVSAVFATSIAFMLVPTVCAVAALLIGIKKKSLRAGVKIFACCVPCLLLGACYMAVK